MKFARPYRLETHAGRVLSTHTSADQARRAAAKLRHLRPDHEPMRIVKRPTP